MPNKYKQKNKNTASGPTVTKPASAAKKLDAKSDALERNFEFPTLEFVLMKEGRKEAESGVEVGTVIVTVGYNNKQTKKKAEENRNEEKLLTTNGTFDRKKRRQKKFESDRRRLHIVFDNG